MKKIALAAATVLAGPFLASEASAAENYAKIVLGITDSQEVDLGGFTLPLDDQLTYGAALGREYGNGLRVELGASKLSSDIDLGFISIDTDAVAYEAGVFLDFNRDGGFQPYVGGGFTYMTAEASVLGFGANGDGAGYYLAGGAEMKIDDRWMLDASYRYRDVDLTLDAFGSSFDTPYEGGAFLLGVRRNFG